MICLHLAIGLSAGKNGGSGWITLGSIGQASGAALQQRTRALSSFTHILTALDFAEL